MPAVFKRASRRGRGVDSRLKIAGMTKTQTRVTGLLAQLISMLQLIRISG